MDEIFETLKLKLPRGCKNPLSSDEREFSCGIELPRSFEEEILLVAEPLEEQRLPAYLPIATWQEHDFVWKALADDEDSWDFLSKYPRARELRRIAPFVARMADDYTPVFFLSGENLYGTLSLHWEFPKGAVRGVEELISVYQLISHAVVSMRMENKTDQLVVAVPSGSRGAATLNQRFAGAIHGCAIQISIPKAMPLLWQLNRSTWFRLGAIHHLGVGLDQKNHEPVLFYGSNEWEILCGTCLHEMVRPHTSVH